MSHDSSLTLQCTFSSCIHRFILIFPIPYRLFELYVHHVATDKLLNLPTKMASSSVEWCWWTICGHKYLANKSYRSKTICGTFSMFNIIETPQNYFTRDLLHDGLGSNVALHFNVSYWRPYLVVRCSKKVFCWPSMAPVVVFNCMHNSSKIFKSRSSD